jgi:shikimate dehydrogenase
VTPWAEVIGDPIAHSKSPAIYGFWLNALGIQGDYRATRVAPDGLRDFFAERSADPDWRGCSVTAPNKLAVLPFLDRLSDTAERTGAVNCIRREGDTLTGLNTDVDGIGEALAGVNLDGRKAILIGAGGAARAALTYLSSVGASEIIVLARDPKKASQALANARDVRALNAEAIAGAHLIVNASTLGMSQASPMPESLLAALATASSGATAFDMVYQPLDTLFLRAARANGLRRIDGLNMLIGQAREAFRLFFNAEAPRGRDPELRALLVR